MRAVVAPSGPAHTTKGSAVVVICVDRGGVGRDDGTRWQAEGSEIPNFALKLSEKSPDAQNVASRRQRSARSGSNTRVEHTLRESLAPLFRQFLEGLFSEVELPLNGALGSSFPLGMRSAYRALDLVTAWKWCSTNFGFRGF